MADSNPGDDVDMQAPGPAPTPPPTRPRGSPRPGPAEAESSQVKGKRKRTDNEPEAESSQAKKLRTRLPVRSKKPKRPNDWHMRKGEIPKGAEKTKAALELHLRTLWRLPVQSAVPRVITDDEKIPYTRRFASEAQVQHSVSSNLQDNSGYINDARTRMQDLLNSLPAGSIISKNIRRITEPHLLFMFRMVACFGLQHWAPDVLSNDPDSMYNLLHEHIALSTFEQVAGAYGYSFMQTNLSYIRDFSFMRRLYRSFVFSYMYSIAKVEGKTPGSVVKNKVMNNITKRRNELKDGRVAVVKAEGFSLHVLSLVKEREAHSDDEMVEEPNLNGSGTGGIYKIKEKEGRSKKVTNFYRNLLDSKRRRMAESKGTYHKQERKRQDPDPPQPSRLTKLPKKVAVDWFEPGFWNNSLTLRERADYTKDGVKVALPAEEHCTTWEKINSWKTLDEKTFMEKYGNAVLKSYNIPTAQEREMLEKLEEAEEEEEVEDELDEEDEEE